MYAFPKKFIITKELLNNMEKKNILMSQDIITVIKITLKKY